MNLADSLQERIDALKRKCSTGYGCGSACISLRKECRSNPGSAMGKERLKRLMELASGESSRQRGIAPVKATEAGQLAGAISARRNQEAARLQSNRIRTEPPMPGAYRLTASDKKKIKIRTEEEYMQQLAAFDANKARLGKRFGLEKRNYASRLLRSTQNYLLGKGQGALDLAMGKPYAGIMPTTQSFENAYRLGYYTGYTERGNLRDLIQHNENFADFRKSPQSASKPASSRFLRPDEDVSKREAVEDINAILRGEKPQFRPQGMPDYLPDFD